MAVMAPAGRGLPAPTPPGKAILALESPIHVQKRSAAPRPVAPCAKKTRDLPDLCICHGCGVRYPNNGVKLSLHALKSQWRALLLCANCLAAVRAGSLCSYCLLRFREEGMGYLNCLRCRYRVHLECVPRLRGFVVPTDLDPGTFVCVDCSAVPEFLRIRARCGNGAAGISLEDVVRNASYIVARKEEEVSKAKDKVLQKALVAKRATELARGALDLVKPDLPDGELALQLHRAINGSHRILRSQQLPMDPRNGNKIAALGKENKAIEAVDVGSARSMACDLKACRESPPDLISFADGGLARANENGTRNGDEVAGKVELICWSERVVSSAGGGSTGDSTSLHFERSDSVVDEHGRGTEDASADNLGAAYGIRDRYLKKYIRSCRIKRYGKKYGRSSRLGNHVGEVERQGYVSVFVSTHSLSSSNSSTSIADVHPEFLTVAPNASRDPKHSPGCKS